MKYAISLFILFISTLLSNFLLKLPIVTCVHACRCISAGPDFNNENSLYRLAGRAPMKSYPRRWPRIQQSQHPLLHKKSPLYVGSREHTSHWTLLMLAFFWCQIFYLFCQWCHFFLFSINGRSHQVTVAASKALFRLSAKVSSTTSRSFPGGKIICPSNS